MAAIEAEVIAPEGQQTRSRRTYSDADKARALALYDLCQNLPEASRKSGIATSTLWQWITEARDKNNKNVARLRNAHGQDLATQFEEIAFETARVAKEKLLRRDAKKIPFGQLMEGASKAVQNMQLLRGQPTSIHEERTIDSRQVLVLLQDSLGQSDSTPPRPALNSASDTQSET